MNRTDPTGIPDRPAGGRWQDADAGLLEALERAAPGRVAARPSDRLTMAHDASHYLLVPDAVVTPRDAGQVADLLRVAGARGVSLTFRSGGTSLSGQATNEGVLLDTRREFRGIEVLDEGRRVRVQPGATVRAVNARLAAHHRKLGPDPASEIACTIGGVVANNSSGMACGTTQNTYRTLESAVLVLPSGAVVDTAAPDADQALRAREPRIHAGLLRLRDRVRANPASTATIERLYAIKNTMGYGVNSFLDHDLAVDVLLHLVVGSEGTLAFVAEATFATVPLHPLAATGLLVFPDLRAATAALPALVDAGFDTIELLDASSLAVARTLTTAVDALPEMTVGAHAALLVEHQTSDGHELLDRIADSHRLFADLPLTAGASLSQDRRRRAALWHIRKGLYTAVAGARPSGTTALLEDIAVPVARLLPTCTALTELFERHDYRGSVIFGHAKDGNVHFMLSEDFDDPQQVARYLAFTEDMVDLVLAEGGTLKAEHGTGRIMAPYVRRQYGDEIFEVMREVKQLIDPGGLLNPGVLLDEDPAATVAHLKSTPIVETEVDRCVECGYCEPVCPSKDLTLTPRRRIALRRELAAARAAGDLDLVDRLTAEERYDSVDTCAVDGLCETACPVGIDTGDLTRRLRAESARTTERRVWGLAARHWDATTQVASAGLSIAAAIPDALPRRATEVGRRLLGSDTVPSWSNDLPGGGRRRRPVPGANPVAVFFPACISTMFGTDDGPDSGEALLALCGRAGIEVVVPYSVAGLCCGTPWKSKGLAVGHAAMARQVTPVLLEASAGGRLPVVVDATSCTEGLRVLLGDIGLTVVDAVTFVDEVVLPLLPAARRAAAVVVHPTCSSARLGIDDALLRVAGACAQVVVEPEDWSCCAFAGDRGLLHPELTASATAAESRSVRALSQGRTDVVHASVNRTCELGMSRATGHPYRHVLQLLEAATRPTPSTNRTDHPEENP